MSSDTWIAVAEFLAIGITLAGGAAWAAKSFMTRDEHARICSERNEDTRRRLDEIAETLKEDRKEAREHRDHMANSVHAIGLKVATIEAQLRTEGKLRARG